MLIEAQRDFDTFAGVSAATTMSDSPLNTLPSIVHSLPVELDAVLDDNVLDALSDVELRKILTKRTRDLTGLTPRDFQLDAAIALWRNRDLMVIAGTGSGKTLSFVMSCFLSKNVVVVIVSPLNALQEDQVSLDRSLTSN